MADKHRKSTRLHCSAEKCKLRPPLLGTAEIWDADTPKCWPGRGAAGSPVTAGTAT